MNTQLNKLVFVEEYKGMEIRLIEGENTFITVAIIDNGWGRERFYAKRGDAVSEAKKRIDNMH